MGDKSSVPIGGECDPRFAPVREAFAANFAQHGEIGAAVTVFVGGRKVADLWGGWADRARTRPWAADTLVNFFSIGKAITAACVLRVMQLGLLDLDTPVARVRRGRQGRDHAAPADVAPGRPAGHLPAAAAARNHARLGPHGGPAGRAGA